MARTANDRFGSVAAIFPWKPLRIASGVRKPKRQILGGYFSGEVERLGKDVTDFSSGDQVFGAARLKLGAYGEYVALPASYTIFARPSTMSHAEAAAVPLGGLNALHFMQLARIQEGEKILINGAGGSIGTHGVQIAKSMGAEVTAVDRNIKKDLFRRLGAAPFKTATFAFAQETREELLMLKQRIEDGKIKSIVDRVYPMEQAADSHSRVETEQRLGAIVIAMDDRADDSHAR